MNAVVWQMVSSGVEQQVHPAMPMAQFVYQNRDAITRIMRNYGRKAHADAPDFIEQFAELLFSNQEFAREVEALQKRYAGFIITFIVAAVAMGISLGVQRRMGKRAEETIADIAAKQAAADLKISYYQLIGQQREADAVRYAAGASMSASKAAAEQQQKLYAVAVGAGVIVGAVGLFYYALK